MATSSRLTAACLRTDIPVRTPWAAAQRGPHRQGGVAQPGRGKVAAARSQHRPAGGVRAAADSVEDDIVALTAGGEVFGGVVVYVRGAERRDQLDVAVAAHAVDLRAEMPVQLDGVRADAAGGTDDQDLLARLHTGQVMQEVTKRS